MAIFGFREGADARPRVIVIPVAGGAGVPSLVAAAGSLEPFHLELGDCTSGLSLRDEVASTSVFEAVARVAVEGTVVGLLADSREPVVAAFRAHAARTPQVAILQISGQADLATGPLGPILALPSASRAVLFGLLQCDEAEARRIEREPSLRLAISVDQVTPALPGAVYVSLDASALHHGLCPQSPRRSPGGLEIADVRDLLRDLVRAGRRIVGFDLTGMGGGAWDARVGATLLLELAGWATVSTAPRHRSPSG